MWIVTGVYFPPWPCLRQNDAKLIQKPASQSSCIFSFGFILKTIHAIFRTKIPVFYGAIIFLKKTNNYYSKFF